MECVDKQGDCGRAAVREEVPRRRENTQQDIWCMMSYDECRGRRVDTLPNRIDTEQRQTYTKEVECNIN